MRAAAFLLLLAAAGIAARAPNAHPRKQAAVLPDCLVPGAEPITLVPYPLKQPTEDGAEFNVSLMAATLADIYATNTSRISACAPGFYCPDAWVSDDPEDWPVFCPPTAECREKRLNGEYCDRQGEWDVVPCPAGFYCPTSYQKLPCPSGHACPLGTVTPKKCLGLSHCPAGAEKEVWYGIILVIVLVDATLIGCYVLYSRRKAARQADLTAEAAALEQDMKEVASPLTPNDPIGGSVMPAVDEVIANLSAAIGNRAGATATPLRWTFSGLKVSVVPAGETEPKALLQDVSGDIRPGRVTAIMGPSGAGKTVLFSTLLGKADPSWSVSGELLLNGETDIRAMRSVIGFVPQDDVLHTELSVYDNVWYSSETRLPPSWSEESRHDLRKAVLRALQLLHVQNTPVGSSGAGGDASRGISGGQRRRTSLAVELASAPRALFADEITSGLDATTARDLMHVLKGVARTARIPVATVIHQPRIEIWQSLDRVLFLAPGGRTVFEGPRKEAEAYFADVGGLDFSKGNPADIIIDSMAERGDFYAEAWAVRAQAEPSGDAYSQPPSETPGLTPGLPIPDPAGDGGESLAGAGFLRQLQLAIMRSADKQVVHFVSLVTDILVGIVGGAILTVGAYAKPGWGTRLQEYPMLSVRQFEGQISMLVMFWNIGIAAAAGPSGLRAFGQEEEQYWREASAGYNRFAYFLGYSLAEIPRVTLMTLHFAAVVYLMWQPELPFGGLFLVLLLTFLCADSIAALLGRFVNPSEGPLISTVCLVFVALFNGYPQIPTISEAFYTWYATEAVYYLQMRSYTPGFWATDTFSEFFGYNIDRYGIDLFVLALEWIVLRVLVFPALVLRNRDKQR